MCARVCLCSLRMGPRVSILIYSSSMKTFMCMPYNMQTPAATPLSAPSHTRVHIHTHVLLDALPEFTPAYKLLYDTEHCKVPYPPLVPYWVLRQLRDANGPVVESGRGAAGAGQVGYMVGDWEVGLLLSYERHFKTFSSYVYTAGSTGWGSTNRLRWYAS